jgi:hypothetical protein
MLVSAGPSLQMFVMPVSGRPFQSSVMLVSEAGAYQNETPFKCSTVMYTPEAIFLVVCDPSMNEL